MSNKGNKILILIIVLSIVFINACQAKAPVELETVELKADEAEIVNNEQTVSIQRYPSPQDLRPIMDHEKLKELPRYDALAPNEKYIDLRSRDLSQLDLTNNKNELLHSFFDTVTVWPKSLPAGFNPDHVMNFNKTPGLKIKNLHKQGITGTGISIGIIDYGLLVNHIEYKENLKLYEEIHYRGPSAHFHGPAVTSILVGKNLGIAPEAEVYFIACENYDYVESMTLNVSYVAQSINRLLEINKTLPQNKKLRVISISGCWNPETKGYKEVQAAINNASKQGIFVVSGNLFEYNPTFHYRGLEREALDDPDKEESFRIYEWNRWMSLVDQIDSFDKYYADQYKKVEDKQILLIPIDARTVACASGDEDYVYFTKGGWSWAVPYISGLYALCCQVNPDITPELFWEAAYQTGIQKEFNDMGKENIGKIVDAQKLITRIKDM